MANLIETVITPDFVNPAKEGKATGTLKVGDQYFNVPAEHVRFFQPKTEYKIAYATKDYNGREFKFVRAVEAGGKMLPVEADKPLGNAEQRPPPQQSGRAPQADTIPTVEDQFLKAVVPVLVGNGTSVGEALLEASTAWRAFKQGPGDAQRAKQMGDDAEPGDSLTAWGWDDSVEPPGFPEGYGG